MSATRLPAAQHKAQPWKNGLGVSLTIADFPPGAGFDAVLWQVGSTEISADCPFSDLPRLDRQFMVLAGAGVELTCVDEAGATTRNRIDTRHAPFAFRGDWRTTCRLLDGPVRVLNVITRRKRFRATVDFMRADQVSALNKDRKETLLAIELDTLDALLLGGRDAERISYLPAAGVEGLVLVRLRAFD